VSSLASEASLIVAAFDLFAVKAVVGASRAADLASGDVLTPIGIVEKPGVAPAPIADQNLVGSRPDPKILLIRQNTYSPARGRCNHHRPCKIHSAPEVIPFCDVAPKHACAPTSPIEPPWKVLPWMDRAPHRIALMKEIKRVPVASDMSFTGKMIDVVA
jgi:hypothetical protein